jgi:hypothetical protein
VTYSWLPAANLRRRATSKTEPYVMKKLLQTLLGYLLALVGIVLVAVSVQPLLRAQWLWLSVVLVAGIIGWTGVRIAQGESIKNVLKDVLEMIMWWTG